jgi:hypothetical protein
MTKKLTELSPAELLTLEARAVAAADPEQQDLLTYVSDDEEEKP